MPPEAYAVNQRKQLGIECRAARGPLLLRWLLNTGRQGPSLMPARCLHVACALPAQAVNCEVFWLIWLIWLLRL